MLMALNLTSSEIYLDIKISFNLMNIDLVCSMQISISLILLPIVWPRYLNCCTYSSCYQSTLILACMSLFLLMTIVFVFFTFMSSHFCSLVLITTSKISEGPRCCWPAGWSCLHSVLLMFALKMFM